MTKLPHLEMALIQIQAAQPLARTIDCLAHIREAGRLVETLIRLEHDAHLREIRRMGT